MSSVILMMQRGYTILIQYFATILYAQEWKKLKEILYGEVDKYKKEESKIPQILIKLLITAEDHRFFKHNGVDLIAILRAIWHRISLGRWEGASTIEMQLVRVLTQDYKFSLNRKLKEMFLASLVGQIVPKNVIPVIYLRHAYFGTEMNGIKQVFKKLNIDQDAIEFEIAAKIIACIKYPQPEVKSEKRARQIANRTNHIINLYYKHSNSKTYSLL